MIPNYDEGAAEGCPRLECLRHVLQNAPQDRVWRRRGYFVMCRAFLDRLQPAVTISDVAREAVDQRQGRRNRRARRGKSKASAGGIDARGGAQSNAGSAERAGGEATDGFHGLAASLMALEGEDAFRNIIEFL